MTPEPKEGTRVDQFSDGRYSHRPALWKLIPHRHYYTMTVGLILPNGDHTHGYQCMRCWRSLENDV